MLKVSTSLQWKQPSQRVLSPILNGNSRQFGNYLWWHQVPHKIFHFVWIGCCDILQTKTSLVQRNIIQDNLCEDYHFEAESLGHRHLFWSSSHSAKVWSWPQNIRNEIIFSIVVSIVQHTIHIVSYLCKKVSYCKSIL